MVRSFCLFLFLGLLGFSCSTPTSANKSSGAKEQFTGRKTLPDPRYYIDTNGDDVYENVALDKVPEPVQGKDQWIRDFYLTIRYPPSARENGIGGIVMLEVLINTFGEVAEVKVKEGLSSDCDNEAKRALLASTEEGYTPAVYQGDRVWCKIDVPVGFWLE